MTTPLCSRCISGFELTGEPKGAFHDGAYFHPAPTPEAGSSESTEPTSKPKRAVVVLTDVFGLNLKNPKLLADKYAEALGCDVWVPDMFDGRPPLPPGSVIEDLPQTPGVKIPLLMKLKALWTILTALPGMYANRAAVLDARVQAFIKKIKSEKRYEKVGVVGFCMGGSALIRLASKGLISSAVVCHPGPNSIEEIKAMNVPTAWVCSEEDQWFGDKLRNEAEAAFAAKKDKPEFVEYEFRLYMGTVHGFATRPAMSIPEVKKAFEEAFEQTVGWFARTL